MAERHGFVAFVIAWNRLQGQSTPAFHKAIARWLEESWRAGERRLLLMAFRGAGKSTLIGLFAAWLLYEDPDRRLLVVAADLDLARKMVRTTRRVIERHPLTRALRPTRIDQWAADQFTVRRRAVLRDPSMLGRGVTANLTGSRADIVLCDDVEVPNTSDSANKRADLRERLAEIDYVVVPDGLQLYVGTPHNYYSIYADDARAETGESAPFLAGFKRLVLPVVDAAGTPRWPQRFDRARIAALRRRRGEASFAAQMMLRPVDAAGGRLDAARLGAYDDELDYREANGRASLWLGGTRLVSATCWWDPAFAAPGRGDASVVACVFSDEAGAYRLHRLRYLVHDPALDDLCDPATQLCRQVAGFAAANFVPAVTVETNGLGRFLPGLLRNVLAEAGCGASVVETATRRAKDLRILEAFEAPLAAGALLAHRSVWTTPFVTELREWRPGAGARDDGLDAVAGCLLAEPVRLGRPRRPARTDWRPPGQVKAPDDFSP